MSLLKLGKLSHQVLKDFSKNLRNLLQTKVNSMVMRMKKKREGNILKEDSLTSIQQNLKLLIKASKNNLLLFT